MAESGAVKLPNSVRPEAYELTLIPDLSNATFGGSVSILINVQSRTNSITLNAIELEIETARFERDETYNIVGKVTYDVANETATISFPDPINPGPARLHLSFIGNLNDRLRGFYRSGYVDRTGAQRYLASTQFEATDARRAFPCWDEPSLKATFSVTLIIPAGLDAISNMPEESSVTSNGNRSVHFATTPVMSTYLLAFVVGEMECVEERSKSGTMMRVWSTKGNREQGRFALEVALKLLDYFNDYFSIAYPLPKLDHVAIPDFAAGAMENWGCITYREPALLVDESSSSTGTRQLVAKIVAHEMAHMWFGDLVTMAWWNDLWLNESFASWMGDKAVNALYPEWKVWDQFLVDDTGRALRLDGLKHSHPIEQEVNDPAEIGELFDAISYSKGASVIRMLEAYIGEHPFRNGIARYLNRHRHGNATTSDLWNALTEASGEPVNEIMDSWTKQTGYPYLDIQVNRSSKEPALHVRQARFTYEAILDQNQTPEDTLWKVPLAITVAGRGTTSTLMSDASVSILAPTGTSANSWIKVNSNQTGFYRVKYPILELGMLSSAVESMELSTSERLGLSDDAFALCRAGILPASDFLTFLKSYSRDTSHSVWANIINSLTSLDELLSNQVFQPAFHSYAKKLLARISQKVGWVETVNGDDLENLLRANVLLALGSYGDETTLGTASYKFAEYIADQSVVPPNLRRTVFSLAAKSGDHSTYDFMWDLHAKTHLQEEKVRLLTGLSHFQQSEFINKTLDRSLTDRVRTHETIGLIVRTATSSNGRRLAWRFMKDNWGELYRRYGEGGFSLMYLVEITSGFSTTEDLEDVLKFFENNPTPAAERTIRQSVEKIRLNIAWLEQNRKSLGTWLIDRDE